MRRALLLAVAALAVPATARGAAPSCVGDLRADTVPARPGAAPLRLGINPAGEAGALGPKVPFVPDDPPRTLGALRTLQPAGGPPLALRLNRFFWSDGDAGVARFAALTRRYTQAGFLVELQLRYHPPAGHDGDVAGFVRWVRAQVRRFGANPRVTAVQVTNEVNLTFSPDSSDGGFKNARQALVQGVIAAHDEARRLHYGQLSVGFNYVYRLPDDGSFWSELGGAGPRFRAAVDWVGLDAYPGTFFPPFEPPGGERDGMAAALSTARCYMGSAGLGAAVQIHVEENGYPTGPGRTEARQVQALSGMLGVVDRLRGTFGVSDYRWFDLRDHNSGSENFQHHYGLLRDDYSPKPAFAVLRDLYRRLSGRVTPLGHVRLRVRRHRAVLSGSGLARVRRADLLRRGHVIARLDGRPWQVCLHCRGRVSARLVLDDGRIVYRRST